MKRVTIRIYNQEGGFIKLWDKAKFVGFSKELNAGLGACIVELGEAMNYAGDDLVLNNEVQILISDKDTIGSADGQKLIYSGYISNYIPWIEGEKEGISVNLLGYYTKLAQDIWKNGTTTTFDNSGSAKDIGTQFRELIGRYIAETTNPKISYTKDSAQITSTTTEFRFEMLTYREGIDALLSLSPNDWFWYVNEIGIINFKQKPTTATHSFVLGKHFRKVRVERSMEKLRNAVLFYASNLTPKLLKFYTDDASISKYGRRVNKIINSRIGVESDADKIAESFINEHSNPDIKVIAEITDNNENSKFGYDIESIDPGDTCSFFGFDESLADIFKENILITKVEYSLKKAIITIEPMRTGVVNRTENINGRVGAIERSDVPTSYTT